MEQAREKSAPRREYGGLPGAREMQILQDEAIRTGQMTEDAADSLGNTAGNSAAQNKEVQDLKDHIANLNRCFEKLWMERANVKRMVERLKAKMPSFQPTSEHVILFQEMMLLAGYFEKSSEAFADYSRWMIEDNIKFGSGR